MRGLVFDIQRFSLFDGPGVRTVVFLKGCPLRCLWCHNPEGLETAPQIMFVAERCIGCGECAPVCPGQRHIMTDGFHNFDHTDCTGCGQCAAACCTGALSVAGREMTVEEVMAKVMRDEAFFRESGGGLTLSGGEPFYQSGFAIALLRAAKARGLSTCVETSGFTGAEIIRQAEGYIDVFYFDYKVTGEEAHQKLCGVSQRPILENLSLLDELDSRVVLRCPIIPGINDVPEHYEGIARTAKEHRSITMIHLEPYHKMGENKALQLGTVPRYTGTVPDKSKMQEICEQIETAAGKPCIIS